MLSRFVSRQIQIRMEVEQMYIGRITHVAAILKSSGCHNYKDVVIGFTVIRLTNLPKMECVCPTTLLPYGN
jgi:hypothetical protein